MNNHIVANAEGAEDSANFTDNFPKSTVNRLVSALYHHVKAIKDELCFLKGDVFNIIDESDRDWWYAIRIKDNQRGNIPKIFFTPWNDEEDNIMLENCDWYLNDLKHEDVERTLSLYGVSGTFVVIKPYTLSDIFNLLVVDIEGKIKHYLIKNLENKDYELVQGIKHQSLHELIKYYKSDKQNSIPRLIEPLPKECYFVNNFGEDMWEYSHNTVTLKNELTEGHFGSVYLAVFKDTQEVAIKISKEEKQNYEEFLNEIELMKQLIGVCSKDKPVMIILEYMQHGNLISYLGKVKESVTIEFLIQICLQVCSGTRYLEAKNIVHRDIAPRNMLINNALVCKIADFGLSKICDPLGYYGDHTSIFQLGRAAPEIIDKRLFSIKSDVWAYGVLMWEIFSYCQVCPFKGIKRKAVIKYVLGGGIISSPENCPQYIYDIMKKCFTYNLNIRPSFFEVYTYVESAYQNAQLERILDSKCNI